MLDILGPVSFKNLARINLTTVRSFIDKTATLRVILTVFVPDEPSLGSVD